MDFLLHRACYATPGLIPGEASLVMNMTLVYE